MNLSELTEMERQVLVALTAQIVLADNEVSAEELVGVLDLGTGLGQSEFYDEVMGAMSMSEADALLMAKSVERPMARDAIRVVIDRLADLDGRADAEARMLKRLDAIWR